VEIDKDSRHYTSFITSKGLYQWKRLCMGLKGAPSHFQQQVQTVVLRGLVGNICEIYIDDVIIFGESEQQFADNLRTVLERFRQYNIVVNPDKCQLGLTSVEYCGHVIDSKGCHFSEKKLRKVLDFPTPTKQKDLKGFLGLCGYFRDHVPHYAELAYPLQQMLTKYKKSKPLRWSSETTKAFKDLIRAVSQCPKLFWINDTSDYEVCVETDASQYGIGAYIYQKYQDKEVPIVFVSKTLTAVEQRWHTTEKEAYAIHYTLHKYKHLLRDVHFTLRTDHANLTFMNTSPKHKVKRWKIYAQTFDFDIEHIPGKDNIVADGFSRFCHRTEPTSSSTTSPPKRVRFADSITSGVDTEMSDDEISINSVSTTSTVDSETAKENRAR
jgi:molybdopterin-biosynthesis enzyme MoeA-like protein